MEKIRLGGEKILPGYLRAILRTLQVLPGGSTSSSASDVRRVNWISLPGGIRSGPLPFNRVLCEIIQQRALQRKDASTALQRHLIGVLRLAQLSERLRQVGAGSLGNCLLQRIRPGIGR